jgi:hypothetical protein
MTQREVREKERWVTTDKLLTAVQHVKEEFPEGNARVEVYIKGQKSEKRYGIINISHYHFIPNIVLLIEEIKDGEAW